MSLSGEFDIHDSISEFIFLLMDIIFYCRLDQPDATKIMHLSTIIPKVLKFSHLVAMYVSYKTIYPMYDL